MNKGSSTAGRSRIMIARSKGFNIFFEECPLYPAGTAPSRRLAADRNLQTAVKKDFRKKKEPFFLYGV
jgi:hypothetical protein